MAKRRITQRLRSGAQQLGTWTLLAAFATWALTTIYVIFDLVARVLHFAYWTEGTYHHPWHIAVLAFAFGGSAMLTALLLAGLLFKPAAATRQAAILLVVLAVLAALSPMPYFIHVAEAQLTEHGFAQTHYRTSEDFDLRLSNRTKAPIRICLGVSGDCEHTSTAAGLPSDGVTVAPGNTYLIGLPKGKYRLTIIDPAPDVTASDTIVSVDSGMQN